jgi:hypothetical protein
MRKVMMKGSSRSWESNQDDGEKKEFQAPLRDMD